MRIFDPIEMNTDRTAFDPIQMGFDAAMDGYQYYECPNYWYALGNGFAGIMGGFYILK